MKFNNTNDVKKIYSISIFFIFIGTSLFSQTINVKSYGLKGDGRTDDYPALLKVVKLVNKRGGGTVYFPTGTYYLGAYHTKDNSVEDIEFKNCKNLKVYGENAKIISNGKFYRGLDYKASKYIYSKTKPIFPLSFRDCKNIEVSGLEIIGQANLTTRQKNIMPSGGYLLSIIGCSSVSLHDLNLHHALADGIFIAHSQNQQSQDLTMTNVISSNNARQGMTIDGLINGTFTNCKFINTGLTGGTYGGDTPGAGVDIEPRSGFLVKNITFTSCTFENNSGYQFVCSSPSRTNGVTIQNSIIAAGQGKSLYQIVLSAKNVKLINNTIDCGSGSIYPTWNTMPGSESYISGNKIRSSSYGIMASTKSSSNKVIIENNTITYSGVEPVKSYFPYLQLPNLEFRNNNIIIPKKLQKKGVTSLIQFAAVSAGNTFGDAKGNKIKVLYTGTKKVSDK